MAEEHRRVAAATDSNARALADNLVNQGYGVELTSSHQWVLRKPRRRGDIVVTILIGGSAPASPPAPGPTPGAPAPLPPPPASPSSPPWGPPSGPPAG